MQQTRLQRPHTTTLSGLLMGLLLLLATAATAAAAQNRLTAGDASEGDPLASMQWPGLRDEFLGLGASVQFDPLVQVHGPAFAEDPMNVPISVSVAPGLGQVLQIIVLVDRNPIRKVLEFQPLHALPRFELSLQAGAGQPGTRCRADQRWALACGQHLGGLSRRRLHRPGQHPQRRQLGAKPGPSQRPQLPSRCR